MRWLNIFTFFFKLHTHNTNETANSNLIILIFNCQLQIVIDNKSPPVVGWGKRGQFASSTPTSFANVKPEVDYRLLTPKSSGATRGRV